MENVLHLWMGWVFALVVWVAVGLLTIWALIDPTGFTRTLDYYLKTRADLIISVVILLILARWVWRGLKKFFR